MKIKPLILSLVLLTAPAFSACGSDKESSQSTETEITSAVTGSSETAEVTSATEKPFEFNGTFNEEVYDYLRSNIQIYDDIISIPCTVNDLGDNYSCDTKTAYHDVEHGLSVYDLMRDGKVVADVIYKYVEGDTTPEDEAIKEIWLDVMYDDSIGIAGITNKDTEQNVKALLGEPTDSGEEDKNGRKYVYYKISEQKYFMIVMRNKSVISINMCCLA